MDYFMMQQDARVQNVAELAPGAPKLKSLTREQVRDIPITEILYVREGQQNEYPDFLEGYMLVSERLKRILGKYQKDTLFKTMILIEKERNRQEVYYLMSVPEVDCLSVETVYDKRGDVIEAVLDASRVGHARIFHVSGCGKRVFLRLDVAESILRRDSYGVWFERLKEETGGQCR